MFDKIEGWKGPVSRFLLAQAVSLLGSSLVQYAIIWHITLSTSSGGMLTVSTICGFAPQILVSLFAGVVADRYDRKKIIMIADAAIAGATLILAIAFLSGNGRMWLLFGALAVRSAGTGIQTPAVQSVLPQITPPERLMRINGIHSTLISLTMLLSPAISGAALSMAGLEATLLVDVVTALVGIGVTAMVRIPRLAKKDTPKSAVGDIREGFAYLKTNRFVRQLLLFQLMILFLISPSAFLTPLMVSRTFGAEIWRLTASETFYSVGSVLGGVLIASWGGFKNRMTTTIAAGFLYGLCMIGLGAAPAFGVYLAINLLIGITAPCYNAPITVSIQERVEPAMHGRVFGFMQIAGSCALPLGMVAFGPLADLVRVQSLLLANGGLVILCTLLAFWRGKRRI